MSQTFLALAALAGVLLLSLHTRSSSHEYDHWEDRGEIEAHAASVGAELLDLAGTLPFAGAAGAGFRETHGLDAWDGLAESIGIPARGDTLWFQVRASVQPVAKSGAVFVASAPTAPFRRVQLLVEGEMEVSAMVERVYTNNQL